MANLSFDRVYEWPWPARIVLMAVVFLAVSYLCYLFDLASIKDDRSTAEKRETVLLQQYKTAVMNQILIKSDALHLPGLNQAVDQLKKHLSTPANVTDLFEKILKLGADNYLKISLFQPGLSVADGPFNKIPIKMVMTGTYDQIGSFIGQVANLNNLVRIADFSILNTSDSEDPNEKNNQPSALNSGVRLKTNLTLEIFEKKT